MRTVRALGCLTATILTVISCGYSGSNFQKDIMSFCIDGKITDGEFTALLNRINTDGQPSGFTFVDSGNTVTIAGEQDLISYLNGKGIYGPANKLVPQSSVEFNELTILMDSSASMKGYSAPNGNRDFTAAIVSIFSAVAPEVDIESAYVGASSKDEISISKVEKGQYQAQITNGKVVIGAGSQLDKILGYIADENDEDEVTCLVTDGILSGTNAEISANREFNVKNLPLLENRVRLAAKEAKKEGLDFLIYRLVTSFTGNYYDYQNKVHKLSGIERPYFLIAVGEKSNLQKFDVGIRKSDGFRPTHTLATYNMQMAETVKNGSVIKLPGSPDYSIKPVNSTLVFKKVPQIPVTFKYRINLNALPEYYKEVGTLKNILKLTYKDAQTNVVVDKSEQIIDVSVFDAALGTYDITIEFAPDFLQRCPAYLQMNLSADGFIDNWYLLNSTNDDRDIENTAEPTTFALETLIGGIIKGIDVPSIAKPIDCNINIEK